MKTTVKIFLPQIYFIVSSFSMGTLQNSTFAFLFSYL
jgi:hypothetical protein